MFRRLQLLMFFAAALSLGSCSDDPAPSDVEVPGEPEPDPGDTGGQPEPDVGDDLDADPSDAQDEGLPLGSLCAENAECESFLCFFISGVDQGFCASFCLEQANCPDKGFDCIFLQNQDDEVAKVCVPDDLCIDQDGDTFGAGPACAGRDCDDDDPSRNPAASELCDGLDNDCDDNIDDSPADANLDCETGLPGPCADGRVRCEGGQLRCEQVRFGVTDICDGIDNDCNGQIDDGEDGQPIQQRCYLGPDGTEGVGQCLAGRRLCLEGQISDCLDQVLPFAEVCDGLDNNCDGDADEGNPSEGVACDTGLLGTCRQGQTRCDSGAVVCEGLEVASEELCDGLDNDCDGDIDEDEDANLLAQDCYESEGDTEGVGLCIGGVRTCVDGGFGRCVGQILPVSEVCDGLDNNCDGDADEGNPAGGQICSTGQRGVCARGETTCGDEGVVCLSITTPSTEICDNQDNDCDGDVDEDGQGETITRVCYNGPEGTADVGNCRSGAQICAAGNFGGCVGEVRPTIEFCDSLDNDCDGDADDGNPGGDAACSTGRSGVCAAGLTRCEGGRLACLQSEAASEEVCDGLDNDCDGQTDEDGGGALLTRSCYNGPPGTAGQGICRAGTQTCRGGSFGGCVGEVRPSNLELCDGLDNDCDGNLDEGNPGAGIPCTTGLSGVCEQGVTACNQDGEITCVQRTQASAEVCDGLDNDCDGQTDEGGGGAALTQSCYNGPSGTAGQGICRAGTQTCQGGNFGACVGEVRPGVEQCDGVDNDCDAQLDDGNPGGGSPCSTGQLGVCAAGLTVCQGGAIACVRQVNPSQEVCDRLDNDCDGVPDEGGDGDRLEQSCYNGPPGTAGQGICRAGTQICQGGSFGACVGEVRPGVEQCDGVDNDCDAQLDDGNPGGGSPCSTGQLGVCAAGTTVCQGGGVQCLRNVDPSQEVCDGQDNDCDGASDEDGGGAALTRSCYNGPPGTAGQGVCRAGTQTCQGGDFGACLGQTLPSQEVCDGVDNDCVSGVDNGNPGGGVGCTTGQPGICATGSTACQGGAVICRADNAPQTERCDGIDNDCDGQLDNGFTGLGQTCFAGLGICRRAGVLICNANNRQAQPICDAVPGQGNQDEVCDFNDDDCDGQIDEDFQDGQGVYDTVENCGGCDIDCNNQWPGGPGLFNVNPTCEVAGGAALCGFECTGGRVDLDGIPDNGCEFLPDLDAIYVATPANGGDDLDPDCGGFDAPCATISNAISRASGEGRERVRVSNGQFRENITLVNGVDVLGGHSITNWTRNPQIHVTAITGTTLNPQGPDRTAVRAIGINVLTELSGFTINGENTAAGGNSVGIYVLNSTGALTLRDNVVFAGRGGNGINGQAGVSGPNGVAAAVGGNSRINSPCPVNNSTCRDFAGGPGGVRICNNFGGGTTTVSGGNGGASNNPSTNTRNGNGANGGGPLGGGGGGRGGGHLLGQIVNGGNRCTILDPPAEPAPGVVGGAGVNGSGGAAPNDADGAFNGGLLQWRGVGGLLGASGQHGGGGGGGGAAAGVNAVTAENNLYLGAAGGGGGAGGCAGFGGGGGGGGGGSFAILMAFTNNGPSNPSAMPVLDDNRLVRGQGGEGGNGGSGGAGGDPGLGAIGGVGLDGGNFGFCLFDGGVGAQGGRGGHAGGGSGGTGGVSFDLYIENNNNHNPGYGTLNTFDLPANVTTSGSGGSGGNSSNLNNGAGASGRSGAFGNLLAVP